MTTMQEVAQLAGVSKATVSRVLSGKGYVGKAARERVFKAIEESGYRPNLLARQLATQQSQTIGLVMTNTLYNGSYFSELLAHAAHMTEEHGRQLLLADGKHSATQEREAIEFLLDLRCDAVVIYPRFLSADELDEIVMSHRQPIMVLNRRLRKNVSHCIFADHRAASQAAVEQLIVRGHRDIAFITGAYGSPTAVERLSGYKDALAKHAIALNERLIVEGKWTPQSGAEAVSQLLNSGAPFSALVASNDNMATGAIKRLHDAGFMLPAQVSVMGFDDIPTAPFTVPSLSSVKVPVTEMVKDTINKLLFMLDGGEFSASSAFTGELILRESVANGPFYSP
ncbi:LacI family DNA-binding transcriptional regulator [Enterobacteriaceae bacterium 4M9]|nr:LacI family DNA-binding transcriptional regulator [Enterobacteriaceae bacterium 4M9]